MSPVLTSWCEPTACREQTFPRERPGGHLSETETAAAFLPSGKVALLLVAAIFACFVLRYPPRSPRGRPSGNVRGHG